MSQQVLCVSCLFLYSNDQCAVLLLCALVLVLTSDLLPDLHSRGASPSHCDAGILHILPLHVGEITSAVNVRKPHLYLDRVVVLFEFLFADPL